MDATKAHLQSWQGCQPLEYYRHGELSTTRIGLWINLLLLWWASIPESVQIKVWEVKPELSCRRNKGHHNMQSRIQLPFRIRLDPLKLPKDPLKVVAGSPKNSLKYSLMGALLLSLSHPRVPNSREWMNMPALFWFEAALGPAQNLQKCS